MFKYFTLTILTFVLATTLKAQEKNEKFTWAADVGASYSLISISQRVDFQVGVLATYKRHQFRVAPIILLWSSEAANNPKKLSFSGVNLNYFYNLPTESKRFELYFKYEMAFQFYNHSWVGTYYNPNTNEYESYSDESHEIFYSNSIAYGFTYKPSDKIFLRLDAGGGLYFSSIKGNDENYYGLSTARYDFRGYDDVGGFLKFSFSTGFVF